MPNTWRAVARSVAGPRHVRGGLPCQDRANYRADGKWLFGAVADGAGTARRSDEGAHIAVELAIASLETAFLGVDPARPPSRNALEQSFKNVHAAVKERLQEHADHEKAPIEEFATTLLALVATPSWTAAMQIGDGFAVVCDAHGEYHLLCGPDHGEYLNVTVFVAEADAAARMQVKLLERAPAFICASTDGLERLCLQAGGKPHPGFFEPLANFLRETPLPEQEDGYLMDFLGSPRLNARTDDDRTLLLALCQPK